MGVQLWWPPIRVMNAMMREVMKEVVCQVENSRSIGNPSTTGLNTESIMLHDKEDKECVICAVCTKAVAMQMALPTSSREKDSYAAFVVNGFSNRKKALDA